MDFEPHPGHEFRYLTRADVVEAARGVDVVGAVAEALVLHGQGRTVLPEEAYLGWTTPGGAAARCLAMPGALTGGPRPVIGLKTINASLANPDRGIPRSQGFTLLLDPDTARPLALMEAAYVSAMRTAAVTALAARHLAVASPRSLALIGCGTLARAHAALLLDTVPTLEEIRVYDIAPDRARSLLGFVAGLPRGAHVAAKAAESARACVAGADLVVPVTTVTEGYIPPGWLEPGALVAHVSLDDLTEEAVLTADLLVVDDWSLVRDDPRRLLGRMHRAGSLLGPHGEPWPGAPPRPRARKVDASLADIVTGRHPGRRRESDIVVSNPFGMAILDVAVAARVHAEAESRDIGRLLGI
ncbi:ornithine cyclodeaminase family protein [Sphaerisporangium siamense]|uniref:Ornithine cyclodeaminase n=1 Tax=Sphaerisporangium siamense TaxID=795645 RepID=A0A7W7D3B4_9ACTN|nr:ornithine cyclodeaminase [Sphaerisporangium siamense]MBB4699540.1 ornithine cyclodeaminase [Sphaerisporangium siamense]